MPAVLRPVSSQDVHLCLITSDKFTSRLLSNDTQLSRVSCTVQIFSIVANCLAAQWTHPAVRRCYERCAVDDRLWMHGPEPALAWHLVAFPCVASTDKARHCAAHSMPSSPSTPVTLTTTFSTGISQRTKKKERTLLINSESVSYHRAKPAYMSDHLDNALTLLGFFLPKIQKGRECWYLDGLTF